MSESDTPPGFISLDFERFFPHKFWISTWSKDASYPEGFRYKILTVRDETANAVEMVLLLQDGDDNKEEMHRVLVKPGAIDRYANRFVAELEHEYGIEFEEQDFTSVRTAEEFEEATERYGWDSDGPAPA